MKTKNPQVFLGSKSKLNQVLVVLFAVGGLGLLSYALAGFQSEGSLVDLFALVGAIGYLVSSLGLKFNWRWVWGLIVSLLIFGLLFCVVWLVVTLSQINAAFQAGKTLHLPGIAIRLTLILGAVGIQTMIIRHLFLTWSLPGSSLAIPFIAPTLLAVLIFSVYPIIYNVQLSFTDRNLFKFQPCPEGVWESDGCPSKGFTFTGFDNYKRLLEGLDTDFIVVMTRSLVWTAVCVTLFFLIGLGLALLLNSPLVKGRGLYRTLLIVPWAVPYYISALVWKFFFNGEFGTINNVLRSIGWANPPAWLAQPTTAFWALVIINTWMSYPFFMTIILGALQSIPQNLYEAAEVDGAGWWYKLRRITLPLIRPAVMPGIVLSALATFKLFDTVWMVTSGGPFTGKNTGATEIVMVYAYRQAFQLFNFGYISAFAVLVFVLLFGATLVNLRFARITQDIYQ